VLTGAPPVAATPTTDLPYQFTIRAAAVEHYFQFFREVDSDVGLSRVQLAQAQNSSSGAARALGAGYWLASDDAPCLLGCEPPCPESTLVNPTVARTTFPRECNDRVPGLSAIGVPTELTKAFDTGSASEVSARTLTDRSATASSRLGYVAGTTGFEAAAAGSVAGGTVDRATAHYAGTAHAFVTDLRLPGDRLATVTTTMRVTADPGSLPRVDYLLSLVTGSGAGWSSALDQESFTISGNRVPLVDLLGQFNGELATISSQLSNLADIGVRLFAPVIDYAPGSDRFRVSAPVLVIGAGRQMTTPTPTRDTGVRIGTAVFDGSYSAPDPPLR
jgi:hypothetical protein